MTNSNLLRAKIAEKGFTQGGFASQIPMSKQTFSRKINNLADFTLKELKIICELLEVVDVYEKERIFFA